MSPGDRFNPYRQFNGLWLPLWLAQRQEISGAAKLVYSALARRAGENGACFPGQARLANDIGLAGTVESQERTARKYIKELADAKLLEIEQRGLMLTNRYFFLWHEWMVQEDQSAPDRMISSGQERIPPSGPERIPPSAEESKESKREFELEKEQQEKTLACMQAGFDSFDFERKEKKKEVRESGIVTFFASDVAAAREIEQQHPAGKIAAAVAVVAASARAPVPGLVVKELRVAALLEAAAAAAAPCDYSMGAASNVMSMAEGVALMRAQQAAKSGTAS